MSDRANAVVAAGVGIMVGVGCSSAASVLPANGINPVSDTVAAGIGVAIVGVGVVI